MHMINSHEYSTQRDVWISELINSLFIMWFLYPIFMFSLKKANYSKPRRTKWPLLLSKKNALTYYYIYFGIFLDSSLQQLQSSTVKILWFVVLPEYSIGDLHPLHMGKHSQSSRQDQAVSADL